MKVDLATIDWVSIGAVVSLLGVMATVFMIYYTRKTLKANHAQLEELKRQWQEEHAPNLIIDIVKSEDSNPYIFLKLENIGKQVIRNLSIKINPEFLMCCMTNWDKLKQAALELHHKKIFLKPLDYKLFLISWNVESDYSQHPLILEITYQGQEPYTEIIHVKERLSREFCHDNIGKDGRMRELMKDIVSQLKNIAHNQ